MRHERFAIVLADVAVRDVACFASEVAGELSAIVVLDDDGELRSLQDVQNAFPMKRNKPSDLELICGDARFIQDFYSFTNDALCGTPPDQGDFCCRCTDQRGKFDGCFDAANLSLPLFH